MSYAAEIVAVPHCFTALVAERVENRTSTFRFQDETQELALVTESENDERVVGLVTATDAFEAITGDLEDPLD